MEKDDENNKNEENQQNQQNNWKQKIIIDFLLQSALVEKRVYKRKDRRKRRAVQNAPIRDTTYKTCLECRENLCDSSETKTQ